MALPSPTKCSLEISTALKHTYEEIRLKRDEEHQQLHTRLMFRGKESSSVCKKAILKLLGYLCNVMKA
jgi:hypothetical protein